MNAHPKIMLGTLCAAYLLFAPACKKSPGDDRTRHTAPPELAVTDVRVENGVLYVDAAGSTVHVGITTNIPDWTSAVTSGGGWIAAAPYRDPEVPATGLAVIQKLKLTVAENSDTDSRRATLAIKGSGIERTFEVVQAGAAEQGQMLTFDSPVYVDAAGEVVDVAVTANVEYTVAMPAGCPWIEDMTASGRDRDGMTFRVAGNNGNGSRLASIVVQALGVPTLRRTLVIEQQGVGPAINIDGPAARTLDWDDTELALDVTANVAYRIVFDYGDAEEWIWHNPPSRAMETKREMFALNRNRDAGPRTVVVQFLSDDKAVSPAIRREVTITQEGYPGLDESVFELFTPADIRIPYGKKDIVVEVRTGRQPSDIVLGTLPEWIGSAGGPAETDDVLAYKFAVDENRWPRGRMHTVTFTAGGTTLEVTISQDGSATNSYEIVDYNSMAGQVSGGDFGLLCDFSHATRLTATQAGWPKEWTFGLRRPTQNRFNQMIYHPVHDLPAYGITDYEILACSHATGTWYTVASGSVPKSLYQSAETMRKGHVIGFPTVDDASGLTLRVKNSQGGETFGASEIHLAYDYTRTVAPKPSIELSTAPVTILAAATSASVAVSATTPYSVTLGDGGGGTPAWITHDASRSAPGTVGFAVQTNQGEERSATVTLRSTTAGVDIEKSTIITQSANTDRLSFLSPASGTVELAASGGEFTVDIATDLTMDAVSSGSLPEWLTMIGRGGIDGGVRFRFSATDNDGGARSHTVTFSGGGRTLDLAVVQAEAADLVPALSLRSPASGEVVLGAWQGSFIVVLATNMSPAHITMGVLPEWLTAGEPVTGAGTVSRTFSAQANPGEARDAVLTFSVDGLPAVSVAVSQAEFVLPGDPVVPDDALYVRNTFGLALDAYEMADGDKSTCFTIPAEEVWSYDFVFLYDPDIVSIIYYPRDSDTDHGTLKKIEIQVMCHQGGTSIPKFIVDIPPSLHATSDSRRAGYRIDLPEVAHLVAHVIIKPLESYQSDHSIAEVEFFSPR